MHNDCTLILFGATGDLARRKVLPALYTLVKSGTLTDFLLVAVAHSESSIDTLIDQIRTGIEKPDEQVLARLRKQSIYHQLDVTQSEGFMALSTLISTEEQQRSLSGNRLAYCSVPESLFASITDGCVESGILVRDGDGTSQPWYRIVFEKPFGHDQESARTLYESVSAQLNDEQIYVVDHYLAAELVANIAMVRFTNRILEPLWSRADIDHINITLAETLDVAGRTAFYEAQGAINDVVQNHMLQLLALIAMEQPKSLTGADIQTVKAGVLNSTRFDTGVLGQYDGYREHDGVASDSKTETFASLRMYVDNERWQGVPFYLRTGKCLPEKVTQIEVVFKSAECLLTSSCPPPPNKLIISVVPRAGFTFQINAKKIGSFDSVMPVDMEFCHECIYGLSTPRAYEVVLQEVIDGMRSISVSFSEIESSWRIVDAIKAANLPVHSYACGSEGPKQAESINNKTIKE